MSVAVCSELQRSDLSEEILRLLVWLSDYRVGIQKHPCFLCLWDNRVDDQHLLDTNHRQDKVWSLVSAMVSLALLVNQTRQLVLPPLHIKLGPMRNVNAMDREGRAYAFSVRFPQISLECARLAVVIDLKYGN